MHIFRNAPYRDGLERFEAERCGPAQEDKTTKTGRKRDQRGENPDRTGTDRLGPNRFGVGWFDSYREVLGPVRFGPVLFGPLRFGTVRKVIRGVPELVWLAVAIDAHTEEAFPCQS
jgi:hypothetical protein